MFSTSALPVVRITTELRWTRRGTTNFLAAKSDLLESNLNQAEFFGGNTFLGDTARFGRSLERNSSWYSRVQ